MFQLCLHSIPKHQTCAAVCAVSVRSYSDDLRYLKKIDPAALPRGTGGRSSFNGVVCTVFGATGFIGRTLISKLGRTGTQIIIPYRSEPDDNTVKRLKLLGDLGQILFQPFNLKDVASIKKAVKYSNIVINLVGRDFETRNFSYDDVHAKGAREIAKAAKEAGVERLIHVSHLNASKEPKKLFLQKTVNYFPSKYKGEMAVLDEFPDATIIKPAVVYGFQDRFLWAINHSRRMTSNSVPVYAKGENTIKQPVDVSDVCQGIVHAVMDYSSKGQTYQFIGPESYYLSELVDYFNRVTQRDKFGYRKRDARIDPVLLAKIFLIRYLHGGFWHLPRHNFSFEQIEMEGVSDTPLKGVPTLEDLGVTPARIEDKIPPLLTRFFMVFPDYQRAYEEYDPIVPPKPISSGLLPN